MPVHLLTLTLVAALQAPPAAPTLSTQTEIAAFAVAVSSCTAAKAATPHPLMRTFVTEHSITGPSAAGCGYRQTMPGRMAMVCALSQAGRDALAAEMKGYAPGGRMSGSTSAAKPVWWSECQIQMPDGTGRPM